MIGFGAVESQAGGPPPRRPVHRTPTLLEPDEALRLVLDSSLPIPARAVPLADSLGLRLAEEIRADRSYPAFRRAMMDGYAVRVADAGRTVQIVGEVVAGSANATDVAPGTCLEIMTGSACPPSAEAVVQKEHTRRRGYQVTLPEHIPCGSHIAPVGSECLDGKSVLQPGEVVTPLAVAVMASFGITSVRARPRPSLAVITTGAELVPPAESPALNQIRDSNGPMLCALARRMGLDPPLCLHVNDRPGAILQALELAAACDIVLLAGGVSVGKYDLVPGALRDYGAEIVFHKVHQKPGKPLLFARRGCQLLFGLPGNPLACHLGFSRYVAAAIRRLAGDEPIAPAQWGRLTSPVGYSGGRTFYCLARATTHVGEGWGVLPLAGVSSADIYACWTANCYLTVPADARQLAVSAPVAFDWIAGIPG